MTTKRIINLKSIDKLEPHQERLFRRHGAIDEFNEETKYWTLGDAFYTVDELIVKFHEDNSAYLLETTKYLSDKIRNAVRTKHTDVATQLGHLVIGKALGDRLMKNVLFEHVLGIEQIDRMGFDHTIAFYDIIRSIRNEYAKQRHVELGSLIDGEWNEVDTLCLDYILTKFTTIIDDAVKEGNRHLVADVGDAIQKIIKKVAPELNDDVVQRIKDARQIYNEHYDNHMNIDNYSKLPDHNGQEGANFDPTAPLRDHEDHSAEEELLRKKHLSHLKEQSAKYHIGYVPK